MEITFRASKHKIQYLYIISIYHITDIYIYIYIDSTSVKFVLFYTEPLVYRFYMNILPKMRFFTSERSCTQVHAVPQTILFKTTK